MLTDESDVEVAIQSFEPAVVLVHSGARAGRDRLFDSLGELVSRSEAPLLALCNSAKEVGRALEAGVADVVRRPFDWQLVGRRASRLGRGYLDRRDLGEVRIALDAALSAVEDSRQAARRGVLEDELTELPTVRVFRSQLERAMAAPRAAGTMIAVLLLDLDRFSAINQVAGREVGDAILVEVGERLRAALRQSGWIVPGRSGVCTAALARLGGDQFGVLATNLGGLEDVSLLARHLQASLSAPFGIAGRPSYISASVGSALYPADSDSVDELLEHASAAVLEAKRFGGGLFRFYREAINRASAAKLEIDWQLRRALERGELTLHYQPLVRFRDRRIVAAEALLRWNHPLRGLLGPNEFLSVAEETGLMAPIGAWVLGTACRQLREWLDQGFPSIRMAVNVAACQFRRGDLVDNVRRALRDANLEPASLELELSERGVLGDDPEIIGKLEELKRLGVRLSLDDFGTGDSAISYLKRLPIDILKIDRSFVHGALLDSRDAAITSAMVAMGQRLDLTVVAEGIESNSELVLLRDLGCDQFQGYLFSPPVDANDFRRFLAYPEGAP